MYVTLEISQIETFTRLHDRRNENKLNTTQESQWQAIVGMATHYTDEVQKSTCIACSEENFSYIFK